MSSRRHFPMVRGNRGRGQGRTSLPSTRAAPSRRKTPLSAPQDEPGSAAKRRPARDGSHAEADAPPKRRCAAYRGFVSPAPRLLRDTPGKLARKARKARQI